MVILRCVGPQRFFHEKVIFPFEDWLFHCPAGSDVQIWSHGIGGTELLEALTASDLAVSEQDSDPPVPFLIPTTASDFDFAVPG